MKSNRIEHIYYLYAASNGNAFITFKIVNGSDVFERLENTMMKRDTKHEALEARVSASEKRIDKIYWLGTLLVAVGAPVMTLLTFGVKHWMGW